MLPSLSGRVITQVIIEEHNGHQFSPWILLLSPSTRKSAEIVALTCDIATQDGRPGLQILDLSGSPGFPGDQCGARTASQGSSIRAQEGRPNPGESERPRCCRRELLAGLFNIPMASSTSNPVRLIRG